MPYIAEQVRGWGQSNMCSKIINSCTLKMRGGVDRDVYGKKAGKGPLVQWEKSATLGVSQDQTLFVLKGTAAELCGEE